MQNSVAKYQPAAIFHPVLGSFRILPEYQKLSLPYVLGPLGGGEYTPLPFLSTCSFPKKEFVIEALRKPLNQLFVMNPRNRAVLKSASHVLATTTQTEDLLRLGGASRVSCVFPDVFESPTSPETFQKRRLQAQMGLKPLRLIFSGRALWWKGGSLALRLAQKLRSANIDFRLLMITQGPALNDWIKLSQQLGVNSFVNWSGFLPREELLKTFGESHCFIYPSLHDSSSSAIPEAFSCALPAITVGFGGVSIAASQGTGLNQTFSSLDSWLTSATELLRNWQLNPAGWLEASRLALERSEAFSLKKITNFLQTQVIPSLFTPSAN
jgi:glycosyltransferase involved in cell wall biosynthesis